jgi:hypothetical protein
MVAYEKAIRSGATQEQLISAARRYAQAQPERKYQKLPATWLNAMCWLDEYEGDQSNSSATLSPDEKVKLLDQLKEKTRRDFENARLARSAH